MTAAAFFDVDGTVVRSNIVMYLYHYRRDRLRGPARAAWTAWFLAKCPVFWIVDQFSRPAFKQWFYTHYRGVDAADFRAWCDETYRTITRPRVYPGALDAIDAHRAAGRRVILVTGGIEQTVAPLARDLGVDEFISNRLEEEDGRFTGRLDKWSLAGEGKVQGILEQYPDVDLAESYAYGDSISDSNILSAVGHAVVVNPGGQMQIRAKREGWPVERWSTDDPRQPPPPAEAPATEQEAKAKP